MKPFLEQLALSTTIAVLLGAAVGTATKLVKPKKECHAA